MPDYEITTTESASQSGSYNIEATANRNIVTADVIDYDGLGENYAVIWKKITTTHRQSQIINATGSATGSYENSPYDDLEIPYNVVDNFTSLSNRKVEFYLTYKVGGVKTDRLLCTCEMVSQYTKEGSESTGSQTFSGERVWGASIQVNADFIVYQFRKEEPVDGLNRNWGGSEGGSYDGNYAFESWMVDRDETLLWKFKKHVVGLINIADGVDSEVGYLKEEEYDVGEEGNLLTETEIYSVGVITK